MWNDLYKLCWKTLTAFWVTVAVMLGLAVGTVALSKVVRQLKEVGVKEYLQDCVLSAQLEADLEARYREVSGE